MDQAAAQRVDALLEEGEQLFADGRVEEASERLAEAERLAPRDPRVLNDLGVLLVARGDPAGEDHFRRVLEAHPADAAALLNLGHLLLAQDRPHGARRLLGRALDVPGLAAGERPAARQALAAAEEAAAARPVLSIVLGPWGAPDPAACDDARGWTVAGGGVEVLPVDTRATRGLSPGAALNRALETATGEVVLLLAAAAPPAHDVLETHVDGHLDGARRAALQGPLAPLEAEIRARALATLLPAGRRPDAPADGGRQALDWTACASSHLSVLLDELRAAGGFDEELRDPVLLDLDLGERLAARGLVLVRRTGLPRRRDRGVPPAFVARALNARRDHAALTRPGGAPTRLRAPAPVPPVAPVGNPEHLEALLASLAAVRARGGLTEALAAAAELSAAFDHEVLSEPLDDERGLVSRVHGALGRAAMEAGDEASGLELLALAASEAPDPAEPLRALLDAYLGLLGVRPLDAAVAAEVAALEPEELPDAARIRARFAHVPGTWLTTERARRTIGFRGKRVLEVGGRMPEQYARAARVACWTGTDLHTEPVFRPGYSIERVSALDMPWGDGSFDVACWSNAFEDIHDLGRALQETHRVLRPGGLLFAWFGPIWSGYRGYRTTGNPSFPRVLWDGLPRWSHLSWTREQMEGFVLHRLLETGAHVEVERHPEALAAEVAAFIEKNGRLNRMFFDDFARVLADSPFTVHLFEVRRPEVPEAGLLKRLMARHPGRFEFCTDEIVAILGKPGS